MNLIGEGEEVTIIDAEQTTRVIYIVDCDNIIIRNLTLTGGYVVLIGTWFGGRGGGVYMLNSFD